MRAALRKMGNSSGVIIPKPMLNQIGAKTGDDMEVTVEAGRLVIAPVQGNPRVGWAEDARLIALAEDDAPPWPEFANADDGDMT